MGYRGTAAGLLDADTNMTYAVKYLAGAYHVADGNANRAVHYYAAGYYYAAKTKGRCGAGRANRAQHVCIRGRPQQEYAHRAVGRTERLAGVAQFRRAPRRLIHRQAPPRRGRSARVYWRRPSAAV